MKRRHSSHTSSNTTTHQHQSKKQEEEYSEEKSWVSQLLALLFASNELHVPSTNTTHYRNKITYNLPLLLLLPSSSETNNDGAKISSSNNSSPLSPLADMQLNEVCQSVNDWAAQQQQQQQPFPFREVMAKCSRNGSIMIRLTVQRSNNNDNNDNWNNETIQSFTSHVTTLHPQISCICYNETYTKSRPTKDCQLHLIHGKHMHIIEYTPISKLSYQISPDAFCEVNFEVEDMQFVQTVEWIKKGFDDSGNGNENGNENANGGAILVVSGRDINSYGLGFGSLRNKDGTKVFSEVIAVQHCPLVARDAEANFTQHASEIKSTILHLNKDEMTKGVSVALDAALKRNNYPPVIVVTTGGRKGLHRDYLNFLKSHTSIQCIIYNSCSVKSLEVDVEGFLSGGLNIDDFRSYNFFAGTKYSASVLRLVRRPKTLVLPIGPAGSGKSTLASTLVQKSPANMCLWWQRDLEFIKLRNVGVGMNKSKPLLHEQMISFLRGDSGCDSSSVRILDSTNGNSGARALYLKEAKPGLFIAVVLSCSISDDAATTNAKQNDVVDVLLERTAGRLEGGNASHPSFPSTVDEQRKKHLSILKGIEYPSLEEIDSYKKECKRVVILEYNFSDVSKLSSLPFEVFMRCSISDKLYGFLPE